MLTIYVTEDPDGESDLYALELHSVAIGLLSLDGGLFRATTLEEVADHGGARLVAEDVTWGDRSSSSRRLAREVLKDATDERPSGGLQEAFLDEHVLTTSEASRFVVRDRTAAKFARGFDG